MNIIIAAASYWILILNSNQGNNIALSAIFQSEEGCKKVLEQWKGATWNSGVCLEIELTMTGVPK